MSAENSKINGHRVEEDPKDIQIPVPWGYVSGKWWGPKEIQPILALHGRQDNAGSFDTLMPLLMPNDVSVLCLDMPGHGLSSHYPKGYSYYVYWDGVTLLRRIIKYFKWTKIKLLGHSLGGAISFLYAATYPDEVEFVISLDIASPCVRNITKIASMTGSNIDRYLKYENLTLDSMPCYEREEMIDIVFDAYENSVTRESAEILMKRGMQPAMERGKYYFSRDARLKVALLGMISMDLALAYAANIKCAYLNIRAIPGMTFEEPENYTKILDVIKLGAKKFEYHEVEGTHHVHLNNPERISGIISNFIKG
ncbi:probable serine hydrolase isoform X1 [Neodiprion pinetum]|uniref:probable serine hydrolase isoform X1 n=2 Tax=Neodiprion pinetum TaxID=441929 RepID=UPI00076FAFE0|nr:probable serine hydrolase isoform X1 [Neodiprion pinetum]XP_046485606.1 probable serine hydrolase isoform X1 [Neodiprion pinetum]